MFLPKSDPDPFEVFSSFSEINHSWITNGRRLYEKFSDLFEVLGNLNPNGAWKEFYRDFYFTDGLWGNRDVFLRLTKEMSGCFRKYHGGLAEWTLDYIREAPGVDSEAKLRASFWASRLLGMMAPSNCFFTNPLAVKRFFDTHGKSLKEGADHFAEDLANGDGLPRLSNPDDFKIGENLAASPGRVVYRNRLMELIQYEPATEKTYEKPLVLIQPWLNKYYIFDLQRGNSFVKYLVDSGFTVFATSWKNPDGDMREVSFSDYVFDGAKTAIDVATQICETDRVHAAGYCIGGTALASLMAWYNAENSGRKEIPVVDWTLFAALTDFSEPGVLEVYTSEKAVAAIEELTEKQGFLDKKYISLGFRLLNSDALIWRYHANNYLQGQGPPNSDILYWNSDGTRLTQATCSFFLREFYVKNKLAQKGAMRLGGKSLDLGRIFQPLYVVTGLQDHISPWQSAFKTCNQTGGPVRFVAANDGHIAGIVNPPTARSRKKYWAGPVVAESSGEAWMKDRRAKKGSWQPDWVAWLCRDENGGRKPPPMGNGKFSPVEDAPGTYVYEQ
jgi:polyhydroxyalkanoate synthase